MEVQIIIQEAGGIIPQQKKCKKAEWLSKKTLQKTEKTRKVKGEWES